MKAAVMLARLGYVLRRGGMPAWLGLFCLAAAMGFFVLDVIPATDQLSNLNQRREAALSQKAQSQGAHKLTPAQQLSAFYGGFAKGVTIPDVLAGMHQIATEQQLALEIGEYSMTREQGAGLDQFRITLPVKGSYLQVRKFIAEALVAQPALSLESLSVRREKVAQDAIDGRIVFLLFLEHAP